MKMRWLAAVGATGLLVCLAGADYARGLLEPVSHETRTQLFLVEPGATFSSVADRLEAGGLIRSARATSWLARYRGFDQKLHVGEYELSPSQGSAEIMFILTAGRVKTWSVTIPEGSRARDIAALLAAAELATAADFLAAANDPNLAQELGVPGDRLEGYLYPDTYRLPRGMPAHQIARLMVKQFDRVWSNRVVELTDPSSLSKREIVILASIVEKETGSASERPLIAAVFLNRLDRGMRLETDPTVIYGIPDFNGNLRKKHLVDEANPYNTYRISGLPPGPISNPGADALLAVVKPTAASDFLYFVSRNDGTHHFSKTYREHVNAVNRYQRRRRP
ncbi:MAG: endolytic transglycosylase MltG [Myxococcota bacterium]|nr:endolytic transglycosylase MltG [Myxococcota bacterium]